MAPGNDAAVPAVLIDGARADARASAKAPSNPSCARALTRAGWPRPHRESSDPLKIIMAGVCRP